MSCFEKQPLVRCMTCSVMYTLQLDKHSCCIYYSITEHA